MNTNCTLADAIDRLERFKARPTSGQPMNERLTTVLIALNELIPLAKELREHAAAVRTDGTSSQVGLTYEDALMWAERIQQTIEQPSK